MSDTPSTFKPLTRVERLFNNTVGALIRFGVPLKHKWVLEVKGRRSGKTYRLPVDLLSFENRTFLVAPRGRTQWVRNVEEHKTAVLRRGRRRVPYLLRPLSNSEKPPILAAYLSMFHREVKGFFPVPAGSSVDSFVPLVERYPAFELTSVAATPATAAPSPERKWGRKKQDNSNDGEPPPSTLPDIGEILATLLDRVPNGQQPLLVAYAERLAANRYREWAALVPDAEQAALFEACALREEEIATHIETLYRNAETVQQELVAGLPELEEINRSLFAGRPLAEQLTIQAKGERLGAQTWTTFADHAIGESTREVFLACSKLEEENAVVLEGILGQTH